MLESFTVEFIAACILMGLGIGLDAAAATVIQSGQLNKLKHQFFWLSGITLTHTLFPLLGYSLSYISVQTHPSIGPLVGLIAFVLIAIFIFHEFSQHFSAKPKIGKNHLYINVALILAVSWDALWSGPAKSAQVINWPEYAVSASFLLVGFIVLLMTSFALIVSKKLQSAARHHALKNLHTLKPLAYAIQLTAISYFAWLALFRYTLDIHIHALFILSFAAVVMALSYLTARMMIPAPMTHLKDMANVR